MIRQKTIVKIIEGISFTFTLRARPYHGFDGSVSFIKRWVWGPTGTNCNLTTQSAREIRAQLPHQLIAASM